MDKPNGTYALGVFCTFVRPYVSGESRGISTQKKGFMKDFFDVILESSATDTSDVNKRHYSKAKTAINEGVWAGINQTDLVKFFNGCRKLPQWKASEFFQHLDKARVESLFDDIGIDALSQFQRCLGQVNIKAPSIDKLPSAVSTWLFEILEANADNRDLLVDGTAFQPEFELLDDLPLAREAPSWSFSRGMAEISIPTRITGFQCGKNVSCTNGIGLRRTLAQANPVPR